MCAGALADAGLSVAIVERERVAGECHFFACIPSKTLLRPGEAVEGAREAPGATEAVTGSIDAKAAFAWRNFNVTDYDDASSVEWLDEKGIELLRGTGRIAGAGTVAVGDQTIGCRHIVVATGSDPAFPPVDGLDDLEGVWTNREATAMSDVPRRMLVLGGGPVGVEMAQVMLRTRRARWARRSRRRSNATGSSCTSAGGQRPHGGTATSSRSRSRTGRSSAAIASSSRPAVARALMASGWRPSASTRRTAASPSTRRWRPPRASGPWATSRACGR